MTTRTCDRRGDPVERLIASIDETAHAILRALRVTVSRTRSFDLDVVKIKRKKNAAFGERERTLLFRMMVGRLPSKTRRLLQIIEVTIR